MKKTLYSVLISAMCLTMTGCAGMTAAGIWASICAGVSAGASVWQASKASTPTDLQAADGQTDIPSAETSDVPVAPAQQPVQFELQTADSPAANPE